MASKLLSLLQQHGVDVDSMFSRPGLTPAQAAGELPKLLAFLHREQPQALARATAQQPELTGLLAHPSIGGVLGALASRFLGRV